MNENVPPQDISAERSLLGAMMLSRQAIEDVAPLLSGSDFYSAHHECVYLAALALYSQKQPVDVVTLSSALAVDGELGKVGGAAYLHELVADCPSQTSAEFYAKIVAGAATRRRMLSASQAIASLARSPVEVDEMGNLARREIDKVFRSTSRLIHSFGETIDQTLATLDELPNHVPTPWNSLNSIIGGLRPGALYVVGARPSVGKSALALQMAKSLTSRGSVAFFSLEMSRDDIQMRAVSADLSIDLQRLLERTLTDEDWDRIRDRRAAWANVPLFIVDQAGVTINDIEAIARSVHREKPLAGIVVDYLQLMSPPPGDKRNRQEFVADCSRQLKLLAMDMGVPIIALSQLNRSSEQRQDKVPLLSDLRESGGVEQDADVVILLHREIMGAARCDLKLMVAKNRHGATNSTRLDFQGQFSRAVDTRPPNH